MWVYMWRSDCECIGGVYPPPLSHPMKFRQAFLPLLAALSFAAPAQAGTADANTLLEMIKATGTQVSFNGNHFDKNCIGTTAYYAFEPKVDDLLVVCTDQVDVKNGEALWEVVAHEATHIMQACYGREVAFQDDGHPAMFRQLSTRAPHLMARIDDGYHSRTARSEVEAFWMELQPPAAVMEYFTAACSED